MLVEERRVFVYIRAPKDITESSSLGTGPMVAGIDGKHHQQLLDEQAEISFFILTYRPI